MAKCLLLLNMGRRYHRYSLCRKVSWFNMNRLEKWVDTFSVPGAVLGAVLESRSILPHPLPATGGCTMGPWSAGSLLPGCLGHLARWQETALSELIQVFAQNPSTGTSWELGCHAPNAGGLSSIPGWGTRPHMLQRRPGKFKEIKLRKQNPSTSTVSRSVLA